VRRVVADRAVQHRVAGFERVERRPLRHRPIEGTKGSGVVKTLRLYNSRPLSLSPALYDKPVPATNFLCGCTPDSIDNL
jgi:hypothetical protein